MPWTKAKKNHNASAILPTSQGPELISPIQVHAPSPGLLSGLGPTNLLAPHPEVPPAQRPLNSKARVGGGVDGTPIFRLTLSYGAMTL